MAVCLRRASPLAVTAVTATSPTEGSCAEGGAADGSGNDVTYDPYGNVVSATGSVANNLRFTGQYLDSESGLYYLRAREYDPTTVQFLTVDPAVGMTSSPYAYVASNPLDGRDPSGTQYGLESGPVALPPSRVWYGADGTAYTEVNDTEAYLQISISPNGAWNLFVNPHGPGDVWAWNAAIWGDPTSHSRMFPLSASPNLYTASGEINDLNSAIIQSESGPCVPLYTDFTWFGMMGSTVTMYKIAVAAPKRIDQGQQPGLWQKFVSWFWG